MLRALALILILPPTLLPQGMCLCQFVPTGTPVASQSRSPGREPTASHAAPARPDCSCDSCRSQRAATDSAEAVDRPVTPPGDTPTDRGPGKHWPGCPAAVGDAPLGPTVPSVTVLPDLVATPRFFAPTAPAVVSPGRIPSVTPSGVPPLYISHCTLLI